MRIIVISLIALIGVGCSATPRIYLLSEDQVFFPDKVEELLRAKKIKLASSPMSPTTSESGDWSLSWVRGEKDGKVVWVQEESRGVALGVIIARTGLKIGLDLVTAAVKGALAAQGPGLLVGESDDLAQGVERYKKESSFTNRRALMVTLMAELAEQGLIQKKEVRQVLSLQDNPEGRKALVAAATRVEKLLNEQYSSQAARLKKLTSVDRVSPQ